MSWAIVNAENMFAGWKCEFKISNFFYFLQLTRLINRKLSKSQSLYGSSFWLSFRFRLKFSLINCQGRAINGGAGQIGSLASCSSNASNSRHGPLIWIWMCVVWLWLLFSERGGIFDFDISWWTTLAGRQLDSSTAVGYAINTWLAACFVCFLPATG